MARKESCTYLLTCPTDVGSIWFVELINIQESEMNMTQWQEENDAWFSRADRFDGFDRGDLYDENGDLPSRGPVDPKWVDADIEF